MVFSTRKAFSTRGTLAAPKFLAALTLLGIAALPQAAQAQANLTFSGGSGTPLTMTLTAPVTYTITSVNDLAPFFIFQGVGNPFLGAFSSVTSTMTFRVNGGVAQIFTTIGSGTVAGDVATNDVYIWGGTTSCVRWGHGIAECWRTNNHLQYCGGCSGKRGV